VVLLIEEQVYLAMIVCVGNRDAGGLMGFQAALLLESSPRCW